MKKKLLSLALALATALAASAQTGTWRAYMAYHDVQQIAKGGNLLFVRASNDLYTYNLNDHSITTYDKMNVLSDCYISHIAWNPTAKRLIIVYKDSNIDIMDLQGNVINLASLYLKTMMQDKTVNRVDIYEQYAYLSTGFGIMKVDMQRCEVAESYILNQNIMGSGTDDLYLYAQLSDGQTMRGLLQQNLIDPHNWELTAPPAGIFDQDLSDYNEYLSTVQTLQPGGPSYNNFAFMRYKNGKLYTCGGGYNANENIELQRPANIQVYEGNDEWTILPSVAPNTVDGTEVPGWVFVDMMSVDVDPLDDKHIFGSGRTGLYEYYDGELKNYYTQSNSLLASSLGAEAPDANAFTLVESIMFDEQGKLWVLNSRGLYPILAIDQNGQWTHSAQHEELMSDPDKALRAMHHLMKDSRGLFWFVSTHYKGAGFYCYDPTTDKLVQVFHKLINEDGTTYFDVTNYYPYHITEDLDQNIWISTTTGPFLIESNRIYDTDPYVTQPKIPRNDGTNYADYLMNGANLSCMAIDGGNRKWIGTRGQGLYLISADNMEQLQHFTTENSPLLSDNIESLAYNGITGELFIGTEAGLCSYNSDATTAAIEMVQDDVYAFPNPVFSTYQGLITVRGLSRDADVKILTTSGQLIYQGRSNGGTFTWNGCDTRGRRVSSGIYMVCTATSTGESGVVCKIAMIK